MLVVNGLSKKMRGKELFKDLSFQVKRGEIAVFVGASGAGKTTLLRLLCGLEKADAGTIQLDNKPLDTAALHSGTIINMVFQQFNLFEHLTTEQNITLVLEKVGKQKPAEAKKQAHALLAHYGLGDKANVSCSQLSGGQKQRLAVARALALKPSIICFDEPTSALDPRLKKQLAATIEELAVSGHMVIVVTHDISLLRLLSGTIHLLEQGQLVESVTISSFMQKPHQYPRLQHFMMACEHHPSACS